MSGIRSLLSRLVQLTISPPVQSSRRRKPYRFQPMLELLGDRLTPAFLMWTGESSTDATDARNWWEGASEATSPPTTGDTLYFGSTALPNQQWRANNCDGLTGSFAGVWVLSSYTGTVTFGGSLSAGTFDLEGGAVSQPTTSTDLTVTSTFTWTGGTLNSSANLANVNISGGTATLAPVGGGSVSLGSNLVLVNGATATLSAGTIDITNDGEEIDVGANCGVNVDPGSGLTTTLTSLVSTHIRVRANASWTMNSGTFLAAGEMTNSGTVTLKPDTTVFFPGVANNNYAYFQDGGATYLYGSQSSNGVFTAPGKKVLISGGMLDTIFDDGQSGYNPQANIASDLVITGGDIYINYVPGVAHTVYGQLYVAGNVTWTGGTFHPFVEGNVNAGISPTYSDFWTISGSLSIGGTAALDPTSVVAGLPAAATSGNQWGIIMASNGITALAGTPSYDTNLWGIVPVQGGNTTTWKLEAL